jgi:hypothetical protein
MRFVEEARRYDFQAVSPLLKRPGSNHAKMGGRYFIRRDDLI